uniref:Tail tube n=1 Tax=Rhizobium phage LG08 TaxID=3129229 RepID=A0AAU8HYA8_9CAUD
MHDELMYMIENTGGFFRPNRYRVEIDLPQGLQEEYQEHIRLIGLTCSAAALPGFSLEVKEYERSNSIYRPYTSNVTTTDFKFYIGKNLIVRELFNDWTRLAVDHESKLVGYEDDFVGQFRLYPMGRMAGEGNIIQEIILIKAFPESVGPVTLGYEEGNQIATINVPVRYTTFV